MKIHKVFHYSLLFFSFNAMSADFFVKNNQIYVAKECKPGEDIIPLDMAKRYKNALQKLLIKENKEYSYTAFSIGNKNTIHLTSHNLYDSPIISEKYDDSHPEICLAEKTLQDEMPKSNMTSSEHIIDKIYLQELPSSCDANSKILPIELASQYGNDIMHKFSSYGTFNASLSDGYMYAYYDEWYAGIIHKQFYTIHKGQSHYNNFCIRDPEEANYEIGNVEISPSNQSENPFPIYANGLMQYPIIVKFQVHDKEGNIVPKFSDHMTAVDESGKRMNFIRLYVGDKYIPQNEIEIPIDGEHHGSTKKDWSASRVKNKYSQNINTYGSQDASWHEFKYWVSTKDIAATGEGVKICALIGSGEYVIDSCSLDEHVVLNPIPPILYSENDNAIITKYDIYSDSHEDVYVSMINLQLKDSDIYEYEIEAIPYITTEQSLRDFSLIGRWAKRNPSYLVGQTFYWENTFYVLTNNSNDNITTDLNGFNYWKLDGNGGDDMTKTSLNIDTSFAGATFINVKSNNYFIAGFQYLGWNFDPLRTYEQAFTNINYDYVWASPKNISTDIGVVKGRDQFGNPFKVRILNGEEKGFDISVHSID